MADWEFEQLSGPCKKLILAGASAPHGGLRGKNPVVKDGIRIAKSGATGAANPNTAYGHSFNNLELTGRFSDVDGGFGYARTMTNYVKQFVLDQQGLLISWGDLVLAFGFIDSFESARESPSDVAWTLKISIEVDYTVSTTAIRNQPVPETLQDLTSQLEQAIKQTLGDERTGTSITRFPPLLDPGIADWIEFPLNLVNTALGAAYDMCDQVGDFLNAADGSLNRYHASIFQGMRVMWQFIDLYNNSWTKEALIAVTGGSEAQHGWRHIETEAGYLDALDALKKMYEAWLRLSAMMDLDDMWEAREGDTWESIAEATTGSASNAAAIQNANNMTGPPVAGDIYGIPKGL